MKRLVFILFFNIVSLCSVYATEDLAKNNLQLFISPETLQQKITETALKIDKEYKGKTLTIIMVMKGAICITADLMRQLETPIQLEYLKASSYGQNGTQKGDLTLVGLDDLDLKGKHVLLVDDIFDSGTTLTTIKDKLQTKNPESLKTLVVFQKNIPRKVKYQPDYALFEIGNEFIVGYGLDYKEHFRGLRGIYVLKNANKDVN